MMDDSSLELERILEEVRQADFIPPATLDVEEVEETAKRSDLPPSNVTFIYKLPENPSKLDFAKSIMSSVEKDFGEIELVKPLTQPPENPNLTVSDRRQRSGDIVRNRALDLQDSGDKRTSYFGKKAVSKHEEQRERELRRKEREERVLERQHQLELEARTIHEAFYDTRDMQADEERRRQEEARQAQEIFERFPGLAPPVELPQDRMDSSETELAAEEVYARFASGVDSLRMRSWVVALVCIFMSYLSLAPGWGMPLPKSMGGVTAYVGTLLIMQIVTILLGLDVVISGMNDLFGGKPGMESIVAISCFAALGDAAQALITGKAGYGVPFCFVASIALYCAMFGTRIGKSAFGRTIHTVSRNNSPITVRAAWEKLDNGIVLSKTLGNADGFMFKLTRIDNAESLFSKLSPILLIASVVFSLLSSLGRGHPESILRCFAAIVCGATALTSLWAFNMPFNIISKRLAARGSAIAGWEGGVSVTNAIGLLIKDQDLFSGDNIRINSFRISPRIEPEKAILYASSIAIKSNAGFSGAFEDLLKEYALIPTDVDEFEVLDSPGIRGIIEGREICFGNEAFMHICNVQLTGFSTNIIGAIYLAVDGIAAGVFIAQYTPTERVQRSLIRLTRSKIKPLFATRDFNLTPAMLRNKFKLDLRDIELLPYTERFKLSDDNPDKKAKPVAVLSDNGLMSFAEAAENAKWMNGRAKYGVLINVICSIFGIALMFLNCYSGAFDAASPPKLLLFHLMFAVVAAIGNLTRR